MAPSQEALEFLGGMLSSAADAAPAVATLDAARAKYRKGTSEWLFRYCLAARDAGWPTVSTTRWDLAGADLSGIEITGTSKDPVNLRATILSGTNLRGATLTHVALDGTDLTGADLSLSVLTECSLRQATLTETKLRGSRLARCAIDDGALDYAQSYRTAVIDGSASTTSPPAVLPCPRASTAGCAA